MSRDRITQYMSRLWDEGATPPNFGHKISVPSLLSDSRVLSEDHEDHESPASGLHFKRSIKRTQGDSFDSGLLLTTDALHVNQGLSVFALSSESAVDVEASLGPACRSANEIESILARTPLKIEVDRAVSLLNVSQYNYFHFLVQTVSHLLDLELPHGIPLLLGSVHSGGPTFPLEVAKAVFPNRQVYLLPPGHAARVRESMVVPPITTNAFPRRGILKLSQVVGSISSSFSAGVVYLARGDFERNRRRTMNEEAVLKLLRRKWPSLRVVRPGVLSFHDQVKAVAGASIIIGPHGAQLANLLWAAPRARVIEFVPRSLEFPSVFGALSKTVGMTWYGVSSANTRQGPWADSDQLVDLASLDALMESWS